MAVQPAWNQLSLNPNQYDEAFVEEFNKKVIDDSTIPHAADDDITSNDPYISMQVGLPRGPDDQLEHVVW